MKLYVSLDCVWFDMVLVELSWQPTLSEVTNGLSE